MTNEMRNEEDPVGISSLTLRSNLTAAAIVGLACALCVLFGIITRPDDSWSVFWPANAVLVGMFVRWPRLSTPGGWLGAAVGFSIASHLSDFAFSVDLWIALTGLIGVAACVTSLGFATRQWNLDGSRYVLAAVAAISISSILISVVGSEAGSYLLDADSVAGFNTWVSLELSAMAILVPPILSFPGVHQLQSQFHQYQRAIRSTGLADAGIIAVLAVSVALALTVGGAGTIAIPVPALILCALRFGFFATCLATGIVAGGCFAFSAQELLGSVSGADLVAQLDSARLGIAAVAIAPTVVVSFYGDRAQLIQRLERAATHDFLTGALTRSAFMTRGQDTLDQMRALKQPVALIMVDIDYFKQVNDRFGHVIGDLVLVEFARIAQATLREGSLFGRFGGEEFAVIMPKAKLGDAVATSMRLRAEVERTVLGVIGSEELLITLSVGLAFRNDVSNESLQSMLTAADNALYRAKTSGRNQVIISEDRWIDDPLMANR
jgi:diguanylate cyclase (GGDEF)-like protein